MELLSKMLKAVIKGLVWLLQLVKKNEKEKPKEDIAVASTNFTLTEDFELSGFWWLPTNPDSKLSGTIIFRGSSEISLELMGAFDFPGSSGDVEQQEIILGFTQQGQEITLCDSFVTSSEIKMPGIISTVYTINYMFIGEHYKSLAEITFSSCMGNYSYLEQWISKRVYDPKIIKGDNGLNTGFSMTYTPPERQSFQTPAIDSEIAIVSKFNSKNDSFTSFSCSHTAYIEVKPTKNNDFKWFLNKILEIQSMVTFFVGEPAKVKRVICTPPDSNKKKIEMFFLNSSFEEREKIGLFDMFLPMPRVQNLDIVLNSWFAKSTQLNEVFDLFFGTIYHPHNYVNFNFLALTQAFESYHRNVVGGKYLDDDTYQKTHYEVMVKSIPAGIDDSFRQSLKSRIRFGNDYSLRKRFNDTLKAIDTPLQNLVLGTYKAADFVGTIIDTRNYFTHFDNTTKGNVASGAKLYALNVKLAFLLSILILKELHVEDGVIERSLSSYRKFKNFRYH